MIESLKYDLKIFAEDPSAVELERFIPVFHRWIQAQSLDELLIDVADYRHVPDGPGVMLIAHDAHYAMDLAEGRPGLLYSRRRETHPSRHAIAGVEERLRSVLHCALSVCQHLEAESSLQGTLQFRSDELLLRLNDRLVPPTSAALDSLRGHLEPLLAELYPGCDVKVEPLSVPESRLTVRIRAPYAPGVDMLLARLAGQEAVTGVQS